MILVIFLYAFVLNVTGYQLMVIDKQKAVKHRRRIPERKLFLTGWLGGALGILIAMYKKRHKTQHVTFTAGIPFILIVNVIVYSFIIIKFG